MADNVNQAKLNSQWPELGTAIYLLRSGQTDGLLGDCRRESTVNGWRWRNWLLSDWDGDSVYRIRYFLRDSDWSCNRGKREFASGLHRKGWDLG